MRIPTMACPCWLLGLLLLLVCCTGLAEAWDEAELEVFDVVEEVNQNFYKLLGVPQNANSTDIKKAFRKLSLQLHPDKNSAADAEVQFRNLVSVYDVLKDAKKRDYYDKVLVNGLPNWRSAVYYYRHVRKMGILELSIILFIIITIGQYLVSWAAYFEKRYTYEQVLGSKLQKLQKKNRKGKMDVPDLSEILDKIPTPSVKNTLPFQLPMWTYCSIVGIPSTIRSLYRILEERKQRKKEEEEALAQEEESEPEPEPRPRGPRRRRQGFTPQERNDRPPTENSKKVANETANHKVPEKARVIGGLWTDDDLHELIRLVKKFPGGTPDRWEKIADIMNRTVSEVTFMAKKVKDEGLKPSQPEEEVPIVEDAPKKVKTRAEVVEATNEWSQEQQKAFEAALLKHPKGGSMDRWEKIAVCVEGKNKEECQARYRYLVEVVKKKQTQ
ncbi:dnaJ homolog subfamily C member 1 [Copidosoma floridanum]|uniref:dnaJ homolog subfamily C member 1 n=1 Tax=Copidosoma floridanum TaxID=29053 RepID=UPI0006C974AC|nr:dnaJ homolog subfamily C member 1 [Copidosoma floridanum]